MTLLVVEGGMPGFTRGRELEKMGCKVQDTAELFNTDDRVRQGLLNVLEQGRTEVTLWGEGCPGELSISPVQHELSAAARAFKAQALAAVNVHDAIVGDTEAFRCGVMAFRSVPADLIPAS